MPFVGRSMVVWRTNALRPFENREWGVEMGGARSVIGFERNESGWRMLVW
jgi:hypothetical protein